MAINYVGPWIMADKACFGETLWDCAVQGLASVLAETHGQASSTAKAGYLVRRLPDDIVHAIAIWAETERLRPTVRHRCEGTTPHDGSAAAIAVCAERADGTLWVQDGKGHHGSQVAYCPYCGFQATLPPVRS